MARLFRLLLLWLGAVDALITLVEINHLTNISTECFENISRADTVGSHLPGNQKGFQLIDDRRNLESTVATSLSYLDTALVEALNVPLNRTAKYYSESEASCSSIIQEYHRFLGSTTVLLRAVYEKQQLNRWSRKSEVFENIDVLQALWASRSANKQNLSFIEQQMILYKPIGCFKKINEVIYRGVEVVEFLNDILDLFEN